MGRARPNLRGENGAVVMFVALTIVVVLGMLVLVVDLGAMLAKRRQVVTASDAAALAAALSCGRGEGETAANAQADDLADENAPGAFRVADPVYDPSCSAPAGMVKVHYAGTQARFFAPIFGINSDAVIPATATATWVNTGDYAIFAGSTTCEKTIDWSGSSSDATGGVHSNNEIYVGGTSNTVTGSTTHLSDVFANAGNTFSPPPVQLTDPLPYPVDFEIADFAPGGGKASLATAQGNYHNAGNAKIDKGWLESNGLYDDSTKVIDTGLYYTTSDIDLSISDLRGTVTVVTSSGVISFNGSDQRLEPWDPESLLAFSNRQTGCGDVAIKVDGSNSLWRGTLFAPNGMVEMSGSNNSTLEGSLIANTVRLNGSGISVTAQQCCGRPTIRLVK